MKQLYVNLSGDDAGINLERLAICLEEIGTGKIEAPEGDISLHLALPDKELFKHKVQDMMGSTERFRIGQFAPDHEPTDSAFAADQIAEDLKGIGVKLDSFAGESEIRIPERGLVVYDRTGKIRSVRGFGMIGRIFEGKDILHYLSCHLAQDVALVVGKGDGLLYAADISAYDKLPKDPVTGENRFVGRDLLEFHAKAKTYGGILPGILRNLVLSLDNSLDMLVIDLKGNTVFTDGTKQVRRFERDYIVPLIQGGGMLGYADVRFQRIDATISPYNGGKTVDRRKVRTQYKVMENG